MESQARLLIYLLPIITISIWAVSRKISESRHTPFNFKSQQDAAEVLQFEIDELKGTSVAASDLISNTIRINISCNQCFCFSAKEEKSY